ncbi:hypothetical protein J6590_018074 [Homalodisca vitripennis]|nr:hypothetical protein J6590_018074 [Homalodisca vitripennis]
MRLVCVSGALVKNRMNLLFKHFPPHVPAKTGNTILAKRKRLRCRRGTPIMNSNNRQPQHRVSDPTANFEKSIRGLNSVIIAVSGGSSKTEDAVIKGAGGDDCDCNCVNRPPTATRFVCATIMLITVECREQNPQHVGFPKLISSAGRRGQVFQSGKSCVNSSAKVMSFGKLSAPSLGFD